MKQVSRKQWIKFGIVTLLYLLFLLWVRSWWGLVVVPFIYDIYITKKIPWSWWRNCAAGCGNRWSVWRRA